MSAPQQSGPSAPPAAQILQLATGYWLSRALYIAAHLGIADLLKDGPKSASELAAATATNADALYRILRALASVGVFAEAGERQFALTPLSETLRRDAPDSIRAMVLFTGDRLHWSIYGEMLYSVQTGKPAFDHVYGKRPFEYLSEHPEDARVFDEAMTSLSVAANAAIAEAYDFSAFGTILDAGGGNGALLAAILKKYPQPRGILYDLPHVIEHARKKALLPAERSETIAGSFFEHVPSGAGAYLLKHIIHDWDDASAVQIFRICRRAMSDSSKLLVLEMIVPSGSEPAFVKFLDLEMLVLPGGRERTEDEYRQLLASSGFRLTRVIPTHSPVSVIEAEPV